MALKVFFFCIIDAAFLWSSEYLGKIAVIYGGSLLAFGILALVFTSILIHGIDKVNIKIGYVSLPL